MNALQMCIAFLGRVLLSAIFLLSAFTEMMDWSGTEQVVLLQMTKWTMYPCQENVVIFLETVRPWFPWLVMGAVALKVLGSLMMILGWGVRVGAFLLMIFLVSATLLVHDFWNQIGDAQTLETIMFLKNTAIFGGLLVVLAFGKGSFAGKVVPNKKPE